MCVPKDPANRRTDMDLLYNVASHGTWKPFLGEVLQPFPREITLEPPPQKKILFLLFLFKTETHKGVSECSL